MVAARAISTNVNFGDGAEVTYSKTGDTWGTVSSTCQAGNVDGIDGNAEVCIPGTGTCDGGGYICKP